MILLMKTTRTMREQIEIAKAEGLTIVKVKPGGRHAKLVMKSSEGKEVLFPLMSRCTDWRMRENFRRAVRQAKIPTE